MQFMDEGGASPAPYPAPAIGDMVHSARKGSVPTPASLSLPRAEGVVTVTELAPVRPVAPTCERPAVAGVAGVAGVAAAAAAAAAPVACEVHPVEVSSRDAVHDVSCSRRRDARC